MLANSANVDTSTDAATFGLLASMIGNMVVGASQCLQKYAINRLKDNQPRWRDPVWIGGITLNLLGEIFGNFVALSYTSAAVVAPLGAVALVINGILAKMVLHEHLDEESMYGYALLIIGVLVLLWAAPHDSPPLTNAELIDHMQAPMFLLYAAMILALGTYLVVRITNNRMASINSYVLLAAIFGALTLISSKAVSVSVFLTFKGQAQLMSFLPYVFACILVCAAVSLEFVKQAAITIFDASRFWPLFFAAFNLVSITLSLVLSQEVSQSEFPSFAWRFSLGLFMMWQGSLHVHGSSGSGSFLVSAAPLHLHAWLARKSTPLTWHELLSEVSDTFKRRFQGQPSTDRP